MQLFIKFQIQKNENTVSNPLISRHKKIIAGVVVAVSAITAVPVIAGTIVTGTLVQKQVKIAGLVTRPEGFYLVADIPLDPGGLFVQGATTPASCANQWLYVSKDGFLDAKVYRDTGSSIQFAAALGKSVFVATAHCVQNYPMNSPVATPNNYPVIYGWIFILGHNRAIG
jgi:hypothetical protein